MNYLAIVGTNSNVSTNRMLLQFMKEHFKEDAQLELFEIKDLPAFYEAEDDQVPQEVEDLSAKIRQADGVIIRNNFV